MAILEKNNLIARDHIINVAIKIYIQPEIFKRWAKQAQNLCVCMYMSTYTYR